MNPSQIARIISEDIDQTDSNICVTTIVFRRQKGEIEILLEIRGAPPEKGEWALPGGHMSQDEANTDNREQTATRETKEETGVHVSPNQWVYINTARDGDGLVDHILAAMVPEGTPCKGGDDAARAEWINLKQVLGAKKLAFDHDKYIEQALKKIT